MIVEFIGSTGAGKTTLISEVYRRLDRAVPVSTSYNLIARPLGLGRVSHPTGRNLIQEIAGFPFLLGSLRRHGAFISFTLRMLARQADLSIFTVNNLRSLVRKLGMYEIGRRRGHDQIVLVDEGTVLAAHNLFVYSNAAYTPAEIGQFATLAPLPDVLVYVRAPIESMVERSLRRADPPRELRAKGRASVEKSISRAVTVFDQVVQNEKIRSRVLSVENPDSAGTNRDRVVQAVTEFLLERNSSAPLDPPDGTIALNGVSPERARHVS